MIFFQIFCVSSKIVGLPYCLEYLRITIFSISQITFDFDLRFPRCNNFLTQWPKFAAVVKETLEDCGYSPELTTEVGKWNSEVQPFLYLTKLIPATSSGHPNSSRPNLERKG